MNKWELIVVLVSIAAIDGYAIGPDGGPDSTSPHSTTNLETTELDGLDKPVVVLVPRNANGDRTNEVDLQSITHPGRKVKRCKSLTPLRKVTLSATLDEENNAASESQPCNFINKNEVVLPSSKWRTARDNEKILARFPKSIEEDSSSVEYQHPSAAESEHASKSQMLPRGSRDDKYLCYCINKDCPDHQLRPFLRTSPRQPPKLLKSTNLNADVATAAASTQGSPLIATRQRGRPFDKRPADPKCSPILIPCANPSRLALPIPRRNPIAGAAYPHADNSHQSLPAAPGIVPIYSMYPGEMLIEGSPRVGQHQGGYANPQQVPTLYARDNCGCSSEQGQNPYDQHQHDHLQPQYPNQYGRYQQDYGPSAEAKAAVNYPEINWYQLARPGSRYSGYDDGTYYDYSDQHHAVAESSDCAHHTGQFVGYTVERKSPGANGRMIKDGSVLKQDDVIQSGFHQTEHSQDPPSKEPLEGFARRDYVNKYGGYDDPAHVLTEGLQDPVAPAGDLNQRIGMSKVEGDGQGAAFSEPNPMSEPNIIPDGAIASSQIVSSDHHNPTPYSNVPSTDKQSPIAKQDSAPLSSISSAPSIFSAGAQEARQPNIGPLLSVDDTTDIQTVGVAPTDQLPQACPPETSSAKAQQNLQDLQRVTGLVLEDAMVLRRTIYEAVDRLALDIQALEATKLSPCEVLRARQSDSVDEYDASFIQQLLNSPAIRKLTADAVKALIPLVTGISESSPLGKLADTVIDGAVNIVLGEIDDSREPYLGEMNNQADNIPAEVSSLLRLLINQPAVGVSKARSPRVQTLIVDTVENILQKTKNFVENSAIRKALVNIINEGPGPIAAAEITKTAYAPTVAAALELNTDAMKPLPFIPITEHYLTDGEWAERPGTVGYSDEVLADSGTSIPDYVAAVDGSLGGQITYHSAENIRQTYLKDHPTHEANVGGIINFVDSPEASTEPSINLVHTDINDELARSIANQNPQLGNADSPTCQNPNPAYLGRLVAANARKLDDLGGLEGSDLFYIGDGVKLPLTIKQMDDGSLALTLSPKICQNVIQESCPCCLSMQGHVVQAQHDGGVRLERQIGERANSREVRPTTVGQGTSKEGPAVTVMPVAMFAEKYNLSLHLGDHAAHSANQIARQENMKTMMNPGSPDDPGRAMGYIKDLLAIHDTMKSNRASVVVNALDAILNSPTEKQLNPAEFKMLDTNANGFEYQLDNPIMDRLKSTEQRQSEPRRYRYQQTSDDAARLRMNVAKKVLHWLKEMIVEQTPNKLR